jgi:Mg-chelatase subunit ChlI
VVLDSAASGINTVEREGISIVHPAKFIMIGSGNPQVRFFWGGGGVRG